MRTLEALQADIARAILGEGSASVAAELDAGGADPLGRLSIYQNNTMISLTNSLIANFPVTVRLVDERFFRYAADAFIRRHPPRDARLSEYGGELPRFLRAFPACREVPFVADVAALEWAMSRASLQAEAPALDVSALRERIIEPGDLRIELQPSLGFALVRHPAFEIWQSQQPGAGSTPVEISRASRRYAVSRMGLSVQVVEVSSADYAFRRALKRGLTVEAALMRALARDPFFDLAPTLVALFREGLVVALSDGASSTETVNA
jgi:Putative DNA-binding domain